MVDEILCRVYHFCIGDLPFLGGATTSAGLPGLDGVTDRPECGPAGPPQPAGNYGIREPVDWTKIFCSSCQPAGN